MKRHCNSFARSILAVTALIVALASCPLSNAQVPEKVKERVETLKRTRLADVLYLSEKDKEKFFTQYEQLQKKVIEAREAMRTAVTDIENAVRQKSGDLSKLSEVALEKQNAYNAAMIEKIRALKPMLTDEQYAKFVIFEHNFPLQFQKMLMSRAKKMNNDLPEN